MSSVMLGLGDYRFSVSTAAFDSLRRTDRWRWQHQERIGVRPAAQYLGPGTTEIELQGTILPHYKGGLGQVAAMRAEADKGEPLGLVSEWGDVAGKWVIVEIEETQKSPLANGAPRRVDFRLRLATYGEDKKDKLKEGQG